MKFFPAVSLVTSLACLSACATHQTYVETEDAALGRVVVYRNGIAYYERRAKVTGDTLSLSVPHDKVDDFLKSLTVRHAETGETVPVGYPTTAASENGVVDMAIQLPDAGVHDLLITYITEAPAWKPSYRVVVGDDGLKVEAWAIVDNTSGEDWDSVRVGVGSSSALSFRYDLRSVVNVHRETLGNNHRFAQAPPSGGAVHRVADVDERIFAQLHETVLPVPAGHPSAIPAPESMANMPLDEMDMSSSGPSQPSVPKRDLSRVHALAEQLNATGGEVTIEGYAASSEKEAKDVSWDRANRLRNELIAQGVAPSRLKVVARGQVAGKDASVELKVGKSGQASSETESGEPVGESHFESNTPMSIARGTSAMVSILNTDTSGEVVYLYAPDDARGHKRFAFKAVRFENPTDSTLETGPVTVYGDGRFIGEGLTDAVPPGSTTVIPFALDRQVIVERDASTGDQVARLLKVNRGICTAEVKHTRTTQLKLTNRLNQPARLFVRHHVRKGWVLESSPDVFERQGEAHLFEIILAAQESKTVEVVETTPLKRTVDLRSDLGIRMLRVYLSADSSHPEFSEFSESMKKLLALYDKMAKERETIASLRDRIAEYRNRSDELHVQIASLKMVRVKGELMTHLQRKMKEISQRVQDATIAVVDHKEELMLSRIRFQDGLSELSLERSQSVAATDPSLDDSAG